MLNKEKKIFNQDSREKFEDCKILGGNPNGIINYNKTKHGWATRMYKTMLARTWFPEQVNVSKDKTNYAELTQDEKRAYDLVLAQLIANDSIQTNQLMDKINTHITSPVVNACIARQTFEECLTSDHEVLTPTGWVSIANINIGTKILATGINSGKCYFTKVTKMAKYNNAEVVHYEDDYVSFKCTNGHRIPYVALCPNNRSDKYTESVEPDYIETVNTLDGLQNGYANNMFNTKHFFMLPSIRRPLNYVDENGESLSKGYLDYLTLQEQEDLLMLIKTTCRINNSNSDNILKLSYPGNKLDTIPFWLSKLVDNDGIKYNGTVNGKYNYCNITVYLKSDVFKSNSLDNVSIDTLTVFDNIFIRPLFGINKEQDEFVIDKDNRFFNTDNLSYVQGIMTLLGYYTKMVDDKLIVYNSGHIRRYFDGERQEVFVPINLKIGRASCRERV